MEQLITTIIFFVAGVVSTTIGILSYLERKRLFKNGIRVNGVLEDVFLRTRGSVEINIKFTTLAGQQIRIKHIISAPSKYSMGQAISIVYDRNTPHKCIVDEGPYEPNGTSAVYLGAVLIMVAIIFLMTTLR